MRAARVWHARRGMCAACARHVHIIMLALPSNQGLCGGINTRVSKEVKLALDAAPSDNKPKVSDLGEA